VRLCVWRTTYYYFITIIIECDYELPRFIFWQVTAFAKDPRGSDGTASCDIPATRRCRGRRFTSDIPIRPSRHIRKQHNVSCNDRLHACTGNHYYPHSAVPKQRYKPIRHPKTFGVTLQRYDTVTPRPFDESDYIIMHYTVVASIDVYFPHTF